MLSLRISDQELSRLTEEAAALALSYWTSIDDRSGFSSDKRRTNRKLFTRPWPERGLGRIVLDDCKTIADHASPSGSKFFGYVAGSGEPVGALGELLAAALNQNTTSWRTAPAAAAIEQTVVGWLADAIDCAG